MNVKDFEYIVEIARHGSISKAANRLYISQPALSKYLQRMETQFGAPLFHRIGKQLVPTPAGQCYIEKAENILHLSQQIESEIMCIVSHRYGNINLGLPSSRGEFIISSIIPAFRKEYPYIKISMEFDATTTLLKRLEMGQYDMLLVNFTDTKKNCRI